MRLAPYRKYVNTGIAVLMLTVLVIYILTMKGK